MVLREIGGAGQERLQGASVLIVGVGGLGCPAALYLAAAGVGRIGLVDADRVELSNLQRQVIFTMGDLGQPKALAAAQRLASLNPLVLCEPHMVSLVDSNACLLIDGYDVVISAVDNHDTRYILNDACVRAGKPLVEAGILRFEGFLMTVIPGAGPCLRCVFPEPPPPGERPACAEAGVIGALAGVMGCLQALEAIKIITGTGDLYSGRILRFYGLSGRFREVRWPRRADCPTCGMLDASGSK